MADTETTNTALTTIDNPWSPFTDFENWYKWDRQHGYNTCEYLDRVADVNSEMSDEEVDAELDRAMDEIVKFNPLGKYVKIKESDAIGQETKESETNEGNANPNQFRRRFTIAKTNPNVTLGNKLKKSERKSTRRG